jgi:hypothetical protein
VAAVQAAPVFGDGPDGDVLAAPRAAVSFGVPAGSLGRDRLSTPGYPERNGPWPEETGTINEPLGGPR